MIDALGRPQSLLLLGGTSDIAISIAEEFAQDGLLRVELAARPSAKRERCARHLRSLGLQVIVSDFDAAEVDSHPALLDATATRGDIDVAVVAFGVLGDEEQAWQEHSAAMELATVNFSGSLSVGVCLARIMRNQGYGAIVALSSVAGERVRRSNFVYGSTKAGMDGFFLGLGEALRGQGVHVTVVRPGFVRSTMTKGKKPAPLAVDPTKVAEVVVKAVATRQQIVWVPGSLRAVMSLLRHLPRPVFRRLPI